MKNFRHPQFVIFFVMFFLSWSAKSQCKISYAKKSDLVGHTYETKMISTLSSDINHILKKSFEFAEKVDRHSFRLVSMATNILLGSELDQARQADPTVDTTNSPARPPNQGPQDLFVFLSDLKPSKWNQLTIQGSLVYKTINHGLVPLRGVHFTFSKGKKQHVVTTDRNGEFVEHLHKLVPSQNLSLYKGAQIKFSSKNQPTMKLPIKLTIAAKQCTQTLTLSEVPLEPIVFFITDTNEKN